MDRQQEIEEAMREVKGSRAKFYVVGLIAIILLIGVFVILGNSGTPVTETLGPAPESLLPAANPDAITIGQNSPSSIAVLSNDDANDALVASVTQGEHGFVSITDSGNNIVYTPEQGFFGTDTFTYTILNSAGTSTSTVSVTINNPCSPNPCSSPPSNTCNGTSKITYASTASCTPSGSTYSCGAYPGSSSACPNGCSNGACLAANSTNATNLCIGMTCSSPPANKCIGNTSVVYSSLGVCSGGNCTYTNTSSACQFGCGGAGVCSGNVCSPNPCNSPPAAMCSGNNLTTYNSTSTCTINGSSYTCGAYNSSITTCASQTCNGTTRLYGGTCSSGACVFGSSDLCNTPPSTMCVNSSTLRTFNSSGCSAGTCQYPSNDTNCQFGCASAQCSAQPVKEFNVTAAQFSFTPSIITVNRLDFVIFNITSTDVTHGFALTAYNIAETLSPGQSKIINFTADVAGNFSFFCSVACGAGHSSMTGTFVVNP